MHEVEILIQLLQVVCMHEDEKGHKLQSKLVKEHIKSLEILRITCMHEKDQVLKIVVMEKRKVEIMMPKQDVTKKDEDEESLVFQLDLVGDV
jgi:hypothetical protein